MALTTFALRCAAVRALRGNTFCGEKVFDSEIVPLDQKSTEQKAPFISVYTDESRTPSVAGRDILGAQHEIDLTFEISVSAQIEVTVADQQGGQTVETHITVPKTDAALEAQLNIIGRQIHRVFLASENPWAEVWRNLVVRISRIDEKRGAMSENGMRFAARQITFSFVVINEPPFSDPIGVWLDLINLLKSSNDTAGLGKIIESEIKTPLLADWQSVKADIGLTLDGWLGIGVSNVGQAPQELTLADEQVLSGRFTVDGL